MLSTEYSDLILLHHPLSPICKSSKKYSALYTSQWWSVNHRCLASFPALIVGFRCGTVPCLGVYISQLVNGGMARCPAAPECKWMEYLSKVFPISKAYPTARTESRAPHIAAGSLLQAPLHGTEGSPVRSPRQSSNRIHQTLCEARTAEGERYLYLPSPTPAQSLVDPRRPRRENAAFSKVVVLKHEAVEVVILRQYVRDTAEKALFCGPDFRRNVLLIFYLVFSPTDDIAFFLYRPRSWMRTRGCKIHETL